jgi:hypothetical protein
VLGRGVDGLDEPAAGGADLWPLGADDQRRHVDTAANVVGPAVKEDHGRTIRRTCLGMSDAEHPSIDLFQGGEQRSRLLVRCHLLSSLSVK